MKIKVIRKQMSNGATTGDLLVDDKFICHTLEDVVRAPGVKVWGATAIPAGMYKVILRMSNRFKRIMPALLDVPGFDGILIHKGNTDEDTHGCILVGMTITKDNTVLGGTSTPAFDALYPLIENAFHSADPITIEITNAFPQPVARW